MITETNTKKRLAKTPAAEEFGGGAPPSIDDGGDEVGDEAGVGVQFAAVFGEVGEGVVVVGGGVVEEGGEAPGVAATVMANFWPF